MPGLSLLDRRLLIVSGKGGVGKSSVAAGLGLLGVRQGKRVLVCELHAPVERIAPLLGAPPSGPAVRELAPGLSSVNVNPRDAMREYGLMVLRFRAIYDAVFENRVARYFLRAIPSLAELVMLGKVLHEVRLEERGRPRWDLVVLDAPATGHAVQLLRVPSVLMDTVPPGPLRKDAQWMQGLLVDPAVTALHIVTLPEEMPVNEAIELEAAARTVLGVPLGALVVNAVPEVRFSDAERAHLSELIGAAAPVGPAAAAAVLQATRAAEAAHHLERAREAIPLPLVTLPLLARERWDRQAIEELSTALEEGLAAPEPALAAEAR